MPDFPSATGTLSSWGERKQEREREGGMEEREERQLERLPTAGNQFPVTESLLGSKEEVEGEGTQREDLVCRIAEEEKWGVSQFVY